MLKVAVMSYERPHYLIRLVDELKKFPVDITVYDDCSKSVEVIEYLKTVNSSVSKKNHGSFITTKRIMTDLQNEAYFLLLQADAILGKDWLERVYEMTERVRAVCEKWSVLTLCTLRESDSMREGAKAIHHMAMGHQGGVGWVMNGAFCRAYLSDPVNKVYTKHTEFKRFISDYKVTHWGHCNCWDLYHVHDSIIAHGGVESSINGRDMSVFFGLNFQWPEETPWRTAYCQGCKLERKGYACFPEDNQCKQNRSICT